MYNFSTLDNYYEMEYIDTMLMKIYNFLGSLGSESSLYDSYLLLSPVDASWYFLCFVLGGLAGALFIKKPIKE